MVQSDQSIRPVRTIPYFKSKAIECRSRPIMPPTNVPFIRMNCKSDPMLNSISLT